MRIWSRADWCRANTVMGIEMAHDKPYRLSVFPRAHYTYLQALHVGVSFGEVRRGYIII